MFSACFVVHSMLTSAKYFDRLYYRLYFCLVLFVVTCVRWEYLVISVSHDTKGNYSLILTVFLTRSTTKAFENNTAHHFMEKYVQKLDMFMSTNHDKKCKWHTTGKPVFILFISFIFQTLHNVCVTAVVALHIFGEEGGRAQRCKGEKLPPLHVSSLHHISSNMYNLASAMPQALCSIQKMEDRRQKDESKE